MEKDVSQNAPTESAIQNGSTSPDPNEVITQNQHPAFKKPKKAQKVLIFVSIILICASAVWYFFSKTVSPYPASYEDETVSEERGMHEYSEVVSCGEIIDIIELGETKYIACPTSVFVIDASVIEDVITPRDGLVGSFVTDLEIIDTKLYVGMQGGVSIFDIPTKKIVENLTVDNGLVNGSNIIFTSVGADLWIGTFDGITVFDTTNGTKTNYQDDMDPNSNKHNVTGFAVSDRSIYATIVASVESAGAVVRYDRNTKTWSSSLPSDFPGHTRIDFRSINIVGDNVVVADGNEMWVSQDRPDAVWSQDIDLTEYIEIQTGEFPFGYVLLGEKQGKLLAMHGDVFYTHDLETKRSATQSAQNEDFSSHNLIRFPRNGDFVYFSSSTRDSDVLGYTRYNATNGEISTFSLVDSIIGNDYKFLGVIDSQMLLINSKGKVRFYDPVTKGFRTVGNLTVDDFTIGSFIDGFSSAYPINGTSKLFIVDQQCGQGCLKPHFFTMDIKTGESSVIEVPDDIGRFTAFGNNPSYYNFSLHSYLDGVFTFYIGGFGFASYDFETGWEVKEDAGTYPSYLGYLVPCSFEYELANGIFEGYSCIPSERDPLTIDGAEWSIDNNALTKTVNGVSVALSLPDMKKPYSPFEEFYTTNRILRIFAQDDLLYVVTEFGIGVYDTQSESWTKTYQKSDGLHTGSGLEPYMIIATEDSLMLQNRYTIQVFPIK